MVAIWLDDLRPMPADFDIHVKTAKDAIEFITAGNVTKISLDHDLGEPENGDGYQVAKAIESLAYAGAIPPLQWAIHSGNPVGRKNMTAALTNADRFWA